MTAISTLTRKALNKFSKILAGEEKAPDNILQVDEIRSLVEEGLVPVERAVTGLSLIRNLILAGSEEVVEVMTPRTSIA
ncbi:MAG: hypothetical protein KJN90_12425 [Gammaproteobacteria bacterium]|nr:hypothetical protein [Gammaproteobacteria bacterium]